MTGFSRRVRNLIMARANAACERCGIPVNVFQLHHRRPRGMGGSKADDTNTAANCVLLCPACHREVESDRVDALRWGWLVRQGCDPAQVPVLRRGAWVWLDGAGNVRQEANVEER